MRPRGRRYAGAWFAMWATGVDEHDDTEEAALASARADMARAWPELTSEQLDRYVETIRADVLANHRRGEFVPREAT